MAVTGVLIMGYGGPDSLDAVGPFMCNLTGREPSQDVLARVCEKYESVGGGSPLLGIATELADALGLALAGAGNPLPVALGMRYWHPFIAEAVDGLVAQGVDRIVTVPLSAYEAGNTSREYRAAVASALASHPGVTAVEIPLLSTLPAFVELHAAAVAEALAALGAPGAPVIFSAHSLPVSDVAEDPRYMRGLEAAAEAVAAHLGLAAGAFGEPLPGVYAYGASAGAHPWVVAYQSKGMRGGEWLGPDTDEVIDAAAQAGATGVVVVPLGFATDHMETLYDLDVVARSRADAAGIAFVRSAVPNAAPRFVAALADAVLRA